MAENKGRFYSTEQISENISKTPEGFLLCLNVPLTRTGEFLYRTNEVPVTPDKDGLIRIKRDEGEVFREETIKSAEGKSVTINHPEEAVDPDNWSELTHGTCQNVRRGEREQKDLMVGDLLITTSEAIEAVDNGLREISLGYDAVYEEIEPGLGRQKEIVINHIALVMRGRAGSRCKINDSKPCDSCGNCKCNKDKKNEEVSGMKFKDFLKKQMVRVIDAMSEEEIKKLEGEKAAKDEAEDLPVKLKEIKDTYDRWMKDAEEGKLDVSQLPLELKEIKDADEDEEEKKKAEEARKIKASDKKVKDAEEEGEGMEIQELKELKDQVKELTSIVAALVKTDEEVHTGDKKVKDDEEAKEAEKAEEEKEAVKDCLTRWSDISHRVEILAPGTRLSKPTKDHAKILRNIKVQALRTGMTTDSEAVSAFVSTDPDKLTNDALDLAFTGASEVVRMKNNAKVQAASLASSPTADFKSAVAARDINAKNKAFYNKQKAA